MTALTYRIFNREDTVASGWYWLIASRDLKKKAVRSVNILGYELAVYRAEDGSVTALDAYCPHMGAHLAEGKVEGSQLRCFFHNWRFDNGGNCTDIPCLDGNARRDVSIKSWRLKEQHHLIWIWLGDGEPTDSIPEPPELAGADYEVSLGNHFIKNCHPNVVMINAIDEQHFRTVHHMPGEVLHMKPLSLDTRHIEFRNTGVVAKNFFWGKLLSRFYKQSLTYDLDYWYGSTGTVTLGPDFLHLYIMFALRMSSEGKTEGYALAFTKKRGGMMWCFNQLVLTVTKLAGLYFAQGDTRVFQTIRFKLANPIAADSAVLAFIQHLDKQQSFKRAV